MAFDLFRRHDISGWGKAAWVIGWIVFPFIAVLAYVTFQGKGMAERNQQRADEARQELRRVVGFSAADEIEKLDRLKKARSITDAELRDSRQGPFADPCRVFGSWGLSAIVGAGADSLPS